MPSLIFIWIGDSLPIWAKIALTINSKQSKCHVILLCNKSIGLIDGICSQIFIEDFYRKPSFFNKWYQNSSAKFRDGFWIKSSERFFILNQFMKTYGYSEVFHAELDNLVFDLTNLNLHLNSAGSGFFCPRDNFTRGIASLIYVNNITSLDTLQELYESSKVNHFNDMSILGHLLNKQSHMFFSLPTENYFSTEFRWNVINKDHIGGIFDAAAIGQYLMGIDIRNSYLPIFNGFINENAGCDFNKLIFQFDKFQSNIYLKKLYTNLNAKIYNLHIHSKNFYLIKNGKLPYIISKINNSSKTCIGWKVPLLNKPIFF